MEIIFATGNRNKLREASNALGEAFTLIMPSKLGFDGDIPETHDTIAGNAVQKALFVWEKFHKMCFADDTGLEVDALGGAPGVHSARYAGPGKNSDDNVDKLLKELAQTPEGERSARFRCVIALVEEGEVKLFEGICPGRITFGRQGEEGFGYDPVFIPDGMELTMAEITLDEKNKISHRGKALEKLACHLKRQER